MPFIRTSKVDPSTVTVAGSKPRNSIDGILQAAAAEVEIREGVTVIAGFYVGPDTLEDALVKICKQVLAKYKRPRMFVKINALPLGANNKIQRKVLRNWTPS